MKINIGYYIIRAFMRTFGALPLGFHYAMGRFLSWMAGDVLHYRRDTVMTNIARSFPDKKYKELKQIRKDFYRHFGEIFAEAFWFAGCTNPARLRKAHIADVENPEVLNNLYSNSPSVIILSSHTGNWELSGGFISYFYKEAPVMAENDVCVTYREMSNKAWDMAMQKSRCAPIVDKEHYDGMIETFHVMRYVLSHRNDKKVYNFITDQSPYSDSSKIEVNDFMHQRTLSMNGGAALARKLGMSVVYMGMKRESRGHYKITYTPICEDASRMEVREIMDKYYELLQKDIEAQPSNYLWTHKRWKL